MYNDYYIVLCKLKVLFCFCVCFLHNATECLSYSWLCEILVWFILDVARHNYYDNDHVYRYCIKFSNILLMFVIQLFHIILNINVIIIVIPPAHLYNTTHNQLECSTLSFDRHQEFMYYSESSL